MATTDIDPQELAELLRRLSAEVSRPPSGWINSQGSITTVAGHAETWRIQEFSVGEWYSTDKAVLKDVKAFLERLLPPATPPKAHSCG